MKLWIDCEFNSYLGELISLALVDEDGGQFYRVLEISEPVNPWVAEHVMPILCTSPIPLVQFHAELEAFLMGYDAVHIIADWPEDIAHLMHVLITGPGERLNTPPLTMEVVRIDAPSKVPHNALWDAIGIRDFMQAAVEGGYASILAALDFEPDRMHAVADMANVGYSFMQAIKQNIPDYTYSDTPAEIIADLLNQRDEAIAAVEGAQGAVGP